MQGSRWESARLSRLDGATGDRETLVEDWRGLLGGILGLIGIPAAAFTLLSGITRHRSELALSVAAVALVLGTALLVLAQALDRLLEAEPEHGS